MHESVYPSRYQPYEEALDKRLREAAEAALRGQSSGTGIMVVGPRLPRWGRVLAALGVPIIGLFLVAGVRSENSSRLPAGKGTIFSAQLAGAGTSPEDLILPRPPEPPPPLPPDSPVQSPRELVRETTGRTARKPRSPSIADASSPLADLRAIDPVQAELTEVLFDETGQHALHVPPAPAVAPAVLNVGTRIPAALQEAVVTSPGGTPVTAIVPEDVMGGGRVVLPAGARLVGDAVAIDEDDRVQIVFSAVVRDGRTVPVSGIVLAEDNRLGLRAKVLKKGSKGKRGLGKVLGVVGSTLTFGLIPRHSDLASRAAAEVAAQAARDLSQIEARWTRSDKVLRAPAGPMTVFLRSDLVLP